jgi:hypothetical protein
MLININPTIDKEIKQLDMKNVNKILDDNLTINKPITMQNIDEYDITKLFAKRVFADISTSSFVNTILNNELNISLFIQYIYSIINVQLLCNFDDYLRMKNIQPLQSNEQLYFIFKGGNVLFNIYNFIKKSVSSKNIVAKINTKEVSISDIINEYEQYFSLSDFDFSIYIFTENKDRYNVLKKQIELITNETLLNICKKFNLLLIQNYDKLPSKTGILYIPETIKNVDIIILQKLYNDIMLNNTNIHINEYNEIMTRITTIIEVKTNFVNMYKQYNKLIINKINRSKKNVLSELLKQYISIFSLHNLIDIDYTIQCYNICSYFHNIRRDNYIESMIDYLKVTLSAHIQKLSNNLSDNNFYNKNNLNNYLITLCNGLNKLENEYYIQDSGEYYSYKLDSVVEPQDIIIQSKSNQIISKKLSNAYILKNYPPNYHYVSLNNTIATEPKNKSYTVDFDLLRIKFNANLINKMQESVCTQHTIERKNNNIFVNTVTEKPKLLKTYNIPSEFVDISVPSYNKSLLQHIEHGIFENTRFGNMRILSYKLEYLIVDLGYILFEITGLTPWTDNKYKKRLIRLLFISIIHLYINKDSLLVLQQLINLSNIIIQIKKKTYNSALEQKLNQCLRNIFEDNTIFETEDDKIEPNNAYIYLINIGNNIYSEKKEIQKKFNYELLIKNIIKPVYHVFHGLVECMIYNTFVYLIMLNKTEEVLIQINFVRNMYSYQNLLKENMYMYENNITDFFNNIFEQTSKLYISFMALDNAKIDIKIPSDIDMNISERKEYTKIEQKDIKLNTSANIVPIKCSKQNKFSITFNKNTIVYGQQINIKELQNIPIFTYNFDIKNKNIITIVVDADAPERAHPKDRYYLNYMSTNSIEIIPQQYVKLSVDDKFHRCFVITYVNNSKDNIPNNIFKNKYSVEREKFNLDIFCVNYKLTCVDHTLFRYN